MLGRKALQSLARAGRLAARRFGGSRPELVPQDYRRLERLFVDFEVLAAEQSANQELSVVQSEPFAYRSSRLAGGVRVTSESVDVPSYKVLVVSVRAGSADETGATLGLTTIVKERVKMELW